MNLDASILLMIQNNVRCHFLSAILVPYTHFGDYGIMWLVFTLFLLIFKKTRRAGIIGFCGLSLAFLLSDCCIKLIISRVRPYDAVPGLVALIGRQLGSSCPSGHTTSSFGFALAVFLNTKKRIGIPALVLATLIAFSRLYVGVHYPTDVLLGILTGCSAAIIVHIFVNRLLDKFLSKKQSD